MSSFWTYQGPSCFLAFVPKQVTACTPPPMQQEIPHVQGIWKARVDLHPRTVLPFLLNSSAGSLTPRCSVPSVGTGPRSKIPGHDGYQKWLGCPLFSSWETATSCVKWQQWNSLPASLSEWIRTPSIQKIHLELISMLLYLGSVYLTAISNLLYCRKGPSSWSWELVGDFSWES